MMYLYEVVKFKNKEKNHYIIGVHLLPFFFGPVLLLYCLPRGAYGLIGDFCSIDLSSFQHKKIKAFSLELL